MVLLFGRADRVGPASPRWRRALARAASEWECNAYARRRAADVAAHTRAPGAASRRARAREAALRRSARRSVEPAPPATWGRARPRRAAGRRFPDAPELQSRAPLPILPVPHRR